ncbi:MAG: cell division protein SepF [Clostridiales bacterium]|nr:cell division protein SepF [Clostridiales bacterium]
MGLLDRLMDTMRLNGDDDEYFDDEDDYEAEKPAKKPLFPVAHDNDDDDEEEDPKPRFFSRQSKVVPMKRAMEVSLIKPSTIDDGSLIADYLLAGKAVVLNMEGIHTELAQRIIDFASGAAYSMNGNLQKISSFIFIVTPESVELSGDFQDLLNGNNIDVSGLNIHL